MIRDARANKPVTTQIRMRAHNVRLKRLSHAAAPLTDSTTEVLR